MGVLYVLLFYLIVGIIDFTTSLRKKKKMDLIAYLLIISMALSLSIALVKGVKFTSIASILDSVFDKIIKLL